MSTTPAESERKVRQLENDGTSIYELLTDVASPGAGHRRAQLRQGARLDQIEDNTHHTGARVEQLGDQVAQLGIRVDQLGSQVAVVDTKLDAAMELLRERPSAEG